MTSDTGKRRLAVRIFTADDQRAFAAWSGDCNPMHVDAVAARRLLSGRQVVHGIHTLLWALDVWAGIDTIERRAVRCEFAHPVSVGDEVVLEQGQAADGSMALMASVDGLVCTEITMPAAPLGLASLDASAEARPLGALTAPLDEAPEAQAGARYAAGHAAPAAAFPRISARIGNAQVGAIMALSYCVGMLCPGLHSVFSSLRLDLIGPAADATTTFAVQRYDRRFGLFTIAFDGAVRGDLRAFRRPPPQPQPPSAEIAPLVAADEFASVHAVVLGGSRGLGETTAKILAAGGAHVTISYAAGADDAARVAADVNAAGRGRCDACRIDLKDDDGYEALRPHAATLAEVYYFATPRIYRKKATLFDRRGFDELADFYVDGLHRLCAWLEEAVGERRVTVFVPSTVFIDDRPRGMTEYAMAKAASEILAADLNRALKHVRIEVQRLPRLATDQTASIVQVSTGSTLDVLLAMVRSLPR